MEEEKKINSKNFSKEDKILGDYIEIKEIRLEKMSPGFNFVSLKARHRLNELKNIFSKAEYRDYIRKCKNMYSISSIMNNKYSIEDLYLREKCDINNIISVFNKIDNKLDSQKIKVISIKKNKLNKVLKCNSKSCINFFKNNSILERFISNTNNVNKKFEESNSLSCNSKNINFNSYEVKNNLSCDINEPSFNNQMSKTTYDINNKNKKILNYKTQFSLNILKRDKYLNNIYNKNNDIYNKEYKSLLSNHKDNHSIKDTKKENHKNNKISILKRNFSNFNGIINFQAKQYPLSCKNNNFNITKYGAIIYNHSMFRNKNIVNFLPKNYNLPLLYKKN